MSTVEQAKSELADMASKAKANVNATFDRIAQEVGHADAHKAAEWNAWMAAHPFPDKFKHLLAR